MLATQPNVTPTVVAAAPGPQPAIIPSNPPAQRSNPDSCLNHRPAGSDTDNKDVTGAGWIMYGDMEDVAGSPGVKRPTGAVAGLFGKPTSKRGTGADGEITGWTEAKQTVTNAGWNLDDKDAGLLARCHLIAREVGGRGLARSLAPCFQNGVNTTQFGMRDFEQKEALRSHVWVGSCHEMTNAAPCVGPAGTGRPPPMTGTS
ncbi:hypothetical protein [Kitasatospora sp. NPDC058190]|uniref:hypothetical protein n=1 Tax=Kitasatospora sp. NPDC058190 TaxID=3346371 RepID=UPI0036DF5103